jgi:hypothetical protein
MNTFSEFRRAPLSPWYGQHVSIHASIQQVGCFRGAFYEDGRTLRVQDLSINENPIPEDVYLWLPLGPLASERVCKMVKKHHIPDELRCRAVVTDYLSPSGPSYSLERLSDCEVFAGGKWRTLNTRAESVWGQEREKEISSIMYEVDRTERMERQRAHVQSYAYQVHHRRDHAARGILSRFFLKKEPLTDREYGHVLRMIDADY